MEIDHLTSVELPVLHYAFRVTDAEFDAILARLQQLGVAYRSTPTGPDDFRINTLTASYAHQKQITSAS